MIALAERAAQVVLLCAMGYVFLVIPLRWAARLSWFLLSLAAYFWIWLFWPETWRRMHRDGET